MLEKIGSLASIIGIFREVVSLRGLFARNAIRIETALETGPTTRRSGFTEPAVKITVVNESAHLVKIIDIRLIFCGEYGAPVELEAPPERFHPVLPVDLDSGTQENWYIPAEKLSSLLRFIHRPPSTTMQTSREVKLHARCISGDGRVFKSPAFQFSLDPNSHGQ